MTEALQDKLKSRYRSGRDDLAADFFAPCLSECMRYDRAAGYFSSSALVAWAEALPRIVSKKDVSIRLLISPEISESDRQAIEEATGVYKKELESNAVDTYLEKALQLISEPRNKDLRLELFCWLIREGRLDLRFALVDHGGSPGIYHEKFGVIELDDGSDVGFIGSANESLSAYLANGEFIMVFRSWLQPEAERITELRSEFSEAWDCRLPGLRVYKASPEVLHRLSVADKGGFSVQEPQGSARPPPWPHQQEAIQTFLEKRHGVLEMATGTGKTRTAMEIAKQLREQGKIAAVIVTTDGNDLLQQWYKEVLEWRRSDHQWKRVLRHYGGHRQRESFLSNPSDACLIISRGELAAALSGLAARDKSRLLVIHDEVHGLGAPGKVASLQDSHAGVQFTLGLSATPEREYDEAGTAFIEAEIGPVIYRFGLEDAIRQGILCPFDYVPLEYVLTDDDARRLQNVWKMKAARQRQGKPMSPEDVAIELAKVYKTAEMKPSIFEDWVSHNPEVLKNCIIFVETKEYGEKVLPIVHQHTLNYKTYYAEDESKYLLKFADGNLDCLITCHKLSQGIDLPTLRTVILFSSARAKLETIQRIGRCLRIDQSNPGKRAMVVDFVLDDGGDESDDKAGKADDARSKWLTSLSRVRPEDVGGN